MDKLQIWCDNGTHNTITLRAITPTLEKLDVDTKGWLNVVQCAERYVGTDTPLTASLKIGSSTITVLLEVDEDADFAKRLAEACNDDRTGLQSEIDGNTIQFNIQRR